MIDSLEREYRIKSRSKSCVALRMFPDLLRITTPPLTVMFLFKLPDAMDFNTMSWQTFAFAFKSESPLLSESFRLGLTSKHLQLQCPEDHFRFRHLRNIILNQLRIKFMEYLSVISKDFLIIIKRQYVLVAQEF